MSIADVRYSWQNLLPALGRVSNGPLHQYQVNRDFFVYARPVLGHTPGQPPVLARRADCLFRPRDDMQVKGSVEYVAPGLHGRMATFRPADGRRPDRWVLDPPPVISQQGPQPVPTGQAPGPQRLIEQPASVQTPQQPPAGQYQQQRRPAPQQYQQRQKKASLPRTGTAKVLKPAARKLVPARTREGGWLGAIAQAIKA